MLLFLLIDNKFILIFTFAIIKISMKRERNIPVLGEVIQHKYQYDNHLQKLQRIQALRKARLSSKKQVGQKTVVIQHIKNQRHSNFIQKLFKQQNRIQSQNRRLFEKLSKTSYLIDNKAVKDRLSASSLTISVKRSREKQINRQNSRIYVKLQTSTPFVNAKKINNDYEKTKKISDRLRKYDNSCELKAKKYIKSTTFSNENSSIATTKRHSMTIDAKKAQSGPLKLNLAKFYKKDDIIKNKIDMWNKKPSQILHQTMQRKQKQLKQNKYYGFFNTQFQNPEHSKY